MYIYDVYIYDIYIYTIFCHILFIAGGSWRIISFNIWLVTALPAADGRIGWWVQLVSGWRA